MLCTLQNKSENVSYLHNSFKGFVTFLICSRFRQISANSDIFSKKNFAMILQPIQNLGSRKINTVGNFLLLGISCYKYCLC